MVMVKFLPALNRDGEIMNLHRKCWGQQVKLSSVVIATLFLSGCTSLEVVTFIGSSVTYFVSGKTWTDYAVSAVTQQDCAMDRIIEGKVMCVPTNRPEEQHTAKVDEEVAANVESLPTLPAPLTTETPVNHPHIASSFDTVNTTSERNSHAEFAVLGSYTNPDLAFIQMQQYQQFQPALTQTVYEGSTRYRIIVGPITSVEQYRLLKASLPDLAEHIWRTTVSNEQRAKDSVLLAKR